MLKRLRQRRINCHWARLISLCSSICGYITSFRYEVQECPKSVQIECDGISHHVKIISISKKYCWLVQTGIEKALFSFHSAFAEHECLTYIVEYQNEKSRI